MISNARYIFSASIVALAENRVNVSVNATAALFKASPAGEVL
jgi:hypothetical protein